MADTLQTKSPAESRVLDVLRKFGVEEHGYYGVVSFTFQAGRLVVIRRDETQKVYNEGATYDGRFNR